MTMRFNYEQVPLAKPIPLGGRTTQSRAILFMSVTGPFGTKPVYARVDSGADETLFDDSVATAVGIDLSNAPSRTFGGVVHGGYVARFANVTLRLSDGIELREWPAWVGFVSGLRRHVLGMHGFLEYFDSKFHGADQYLELQVNRLYPGT